jgi:two-component system response regulator DevR
MSIQIVPRGDGPIRVLLVGGPQLARLGLRSLLETNRWFDVVGDVGTVGEAAGTAWAHRPTLIVFAGRPDTGDIDALRELRARMPDTRIVIVGDHAETPATLTRAGAVGCLSRQQGAQSLCRALRELATGGQPAAGETSALLPAHRNGVSRDVLALTAQERRVLELVAHGKTNKEIGSALGLSAKTVKNYLSNAFEKLNVCRRAQAAVLFIKGYGGLGTRRSAS